ncbi:MAG: hypothetical protein Q4B65_01485 [Candidatus Saccharibacteria bacterium]|nr:hypothetical protein [Candidatus Saccharibacteria bacterium]
MRLNVKNTTLPNLLDLLAPHSCRGCGRTGEALCERCKNNILREKLYVCPNCKKTLPAFDKIDKNKKPKNSLSVYKCPRCKLPPILVAAERSGLLGSLIHDFKYNSVRALAKPLAEILAKTLPKSLKENIILVPLPTASTHIRTRALDHTYLIAKHLARLRGFKVEKLLLRRENTVQVGTDEKTRLKQASEAFEINPKIKINPKLTYLLIDDVWTTGASVKSALDLLQKSGTKNLAAITLVVNRLD